MWVLEPGPQGTLIIFVPKLLPLLREAQANLLNDKELIARERPSEQVTPRKWERSFPSGSVVKNPPADAGDTASIPGPRGLNMLWSYGAHVPQLMSLWSIAGEAQLLSLQITIPEPMCYSNRSPHALEPGHCNQRVGPLTTREKPMQQLRCRTAKNKVN